MLNKKQEIDKQLEVFGLGRLQDFKTIAKTLIKLSISLEEYVQHMEQKINVFTETKTNKIKCPKCSNTMNLYPVNTGPRDRVGDNLKSQWLCPKCYYTQFSERDIKSWLKQINENPSIKRMNTE